ncbi:MAG: hypothetical protein HY787_05385 [Deltaproteobacteria bacterium]|nr:hypothetical protein [Deltaproteobacteria bacterium]
MIAGIKRGFIVLMLVTGMVVLARPGISFGEIRIAVVPFEVEYGQGKEIVRCRSCGNIFGSGPIEGNPAAPLTRLLWDLLVEQGKGFDFISPDQVEGYYNILLSKGIMRDPLQLMKTLGAQMKADYVLWGHIFRYQERIGKAYGVEKPASVAFDLHLMKVKDGKLVWKAHWDQTQKALSENLLELDSFIKSNMRWVTAEKLSLQGLKEMLKDFPLAESLR